jgi:UDP-N-acetylglucosamine--N-acetylmuramyl-(pentapeptide) pyrophosphoryl-undecaprenol N-acetylglucosamine transferase
VKQKSKNIIISGGGTGGHVFPAISIANAIREIEPETNILFVGALEKIEMEKVPAAGYEIIGLPVAGLQRKLTTKNISFIHKLTRSLKISKRIIKEFKPDVVVGVGGYASGPILYEANKKKIPTLIQEQNSYAGITNKLLAKKARKICVAYEGMEKYFPAEY